MEIITPETITSLFESKQIDYIAKRVGSADADRVASMLAGVIRARFCSEGDFSRCYCRIIAAVVVMTFKKSRDNGWARASESHLPGSFGYFSYPWSNSFEESNRILGLYYEMDFVHDIAQAFAATCMKNRSDVWIMKINHRPDLRLIEIEYVFNT